MCMCIICILLQYYVVCVCRYVHCMFIVWFLYALYNNVIDVRLDNVPVGSDCILCNYYTTMSCSIIIILNFCICAYESFC